MENRRKEFMEQLKEERTSYADMIEFCCDSLILNNSIIEELANKGFYFEVYCGDDYEEDTEDYKEIYQQFIISERDAERLAEYTNEIVYYNDDLDLYLLGVTHFGTMWNGVPANWKED